MEGKYTKGAVERKLVRKEEGGEGAGERTEGRTKERTKNKPCLTLQLLYFGDKYLQVVTVVISPLLLPFFLSEPAHKSVKSPKQMKV